MFDKLTTSPSRERTVTTTELTLTTAFLHAVVSGGDRVSYASLTRLARHVGEDTSGNIEAQRGAKLVKSLPVILQPYVCRKAGGYAKGTTWDVETPADLRDRPVILKESVVACYKLWQKAVKKAQADAAKADSK